MITNIVDFITASIMAFAMLTLGIYEGAALIALIAALSRIAYTTDKPSLLLFGRFFIMSLSITMLIVHIGLLQKWDSNHVVIVSGISAFMSREILDGFINAKNLSLIKKIIEVFK